MTNRRHPRKQTLHQPVAACRQAGIGQNAVTWETSPSRAVLDFIRRGQRAQATVDAILVAAPERRRIKPPNGHA